MHPCFSGRLLQSHLHSGLLYVGPFTQPRNTFYAIPSSVRYSLVAVVPINMVLHCDSDEVCASSTDTLKGSPICIRRPLSHRFSRVGPCPCNAVTDRPSEKSPSGCCEGFFCWQPDGRTQLPPVPSTRLCNTILDGSLILRSTRLAQIFIIVMPPFHT